MRRPAFTLIEIIITSSLLLLLLAGIIYILKTELKVWNTFSSRAERAQVQNFVLAKIASDIRNAETISSASNQASLILKLGNDNLEYVLQNSKICRKKNGNASYLTNPGEINHLSFSYPSNKLVSVEVDNLTTLVKVRN